MTALYIIAAIIGVILLMLHSRVYINFKYNTAAEDSLYVSISYLFLKIPVIPKKEKKVRVRDYTYKKAQRRIKKTAEAEEKKKLKSQKKAEAKKASAPSAQESDNTKIDNVGKKKKKKEGVVSAVYEIREIIFDILKRFPSKFRLDVNRLHVRVGAADAAKTAITYGVVTEAVGALVTLLEECSFLRRGHENDVMITPDFCSGTIDADVFVRLSIKPASVLALAFRFIRGFISHKVSSTITEIK